MPWNEGGGGEGGEPGGYGTIRNRRGRVASEIWEPLGSLAWVLVYVGVWAGRWAMGWKFGPRHTGGGPEAVRGGGVGCAGFCGVVHVLHAR